MWIGTVNIKICQKYISCAVTEKGQRQWHPASVTLTIAQVLLCSSHASRDLRLWDFFRSAHPETKIPERNKLIPFSFREVEDRWIWDHLVPQS